VEELLVVESEVDHEEGDEDVLRHDEEDGDDAVLLVVVLPLHDAVVGDDRGEEDEDRGGDHEARVVEQLDLEVLVTLGYPLVDLEAAPQTREAAALALQVELPGGVFVGDRQVDVAEVYVED
jgi:hypothetical protein